MATLLLLLALALGALYLFVKRHYAYWERRNIPHEKPHIPCGSIDEVRQRKRAFGLIMADIYNRWKEPIVGIYLLFRPAVLVRDAELVRTILTTDFNSFHDRGIYVDEERDPLSANLFALRGQSWKSLRAKLTPSFSSGKLKGMFGTIVDVGDKMVQHLDRVLPEEGSLELDIKKIFTTYAIDIIGSVIFGLNIDSFANPDNEFRQVSSKILGSKGIIATIAGISNFICPPITKFINRMGYKGPIGIELRNIVRETIEHRERNGVTRKDLLQLLIQLRNTGKISDNDDKIWDVETVTEGFKSMPIDVIAAQAFIFYIAGSETTAATASYTIYELAMNPDLLKKVQDEVEEVLKRHNITAKDRLTYDAVQDMKFLDLCIMETTRKYPGLPFLNRECTQDYEVPGTNYRIEKGTPIIISLFGIHRDPEYFPEPMRYDPERFSEEHRNYNPTAFMPFGEGPRHCIAQRMGQINSKTALVKLLSNFDIEPLEHKELTFDFDPAPVLIVRDGLKVRLSKKRRYVI